MTHLYNRCIECMTELAIDDYTCPDDPEHEVEEVYSLKCSKCGIYTEEASGEICMNCDEEMEEYDE